MATIASTPDVLTGVLEGVEGTADQSVVRTRKPWQWQPGQSGNPAGPPPNLGLSIKGWWNKLSVPGVYTREDLKRFSDSDDDHARSIAADSILRARSGHGPDAYSKGGNPLAIPDLKEISDRTVGKAAQTVTVRQEVAIDPAQTLAELVAYLREKPHLLAAAEAELGKALAAPGAGAEGGSPPDGS